MEVGGFDTLKYVSTNSKPRKQINQAKQEHVQFVLVISTLVHTIKWIYRPSCNWVSISNQ